MLPDSRACTKCGLDKPLSEFSKAPRGKYGVKASCKACDAERYAANPHPSRALPPEEVKRRLEERRGDAKKCTKCGVVKDRSEFTKSRDGKYGPVLHPLCNACKSERAKRWFRDNPDRADASSRRYSLGKNYGITPEQYDALLQQQGGACAICGEAEPPAHGRTGKQFRLSVDHCHKTGRVRGLLCQKCNRAMGLLGDDPILVRNAIGYLKHHDASPDTGRPSP